jgi:hypothetical protein
MPLDRGMPRTSCGPHREARAGVLASRKRMSGFTRRIQFDTTNEEAITNERKTRRQSALVTGANSGIDLATAKRFVAEGAYVFITGRRPVELEAAEKEIGSNVTGIQGDVAKLADLDRWFAQIKREKGKLDIVFANAGVAELAPVEKLRKSSSIESSTSTSKACCSPCRKLYL